MEVDQLYSVGLSVDYNITGANISVIYIIGNAIAKGGV